MIRSTTSRHRQPLGVQRLEPVELVEAVDDDVAHALGHRHAQLVDALVVAVHRARRSAGTPAGRATIQLATGGDVEQHPLLVGEPGHRLAQERLRRVDDVLVAERVDGLAAAVAQVLPRRTRTAACRSSAASSSDGAARRCAARRRRRPSAVSGSRFSEREVTIGARLTSARGRRCRAGRSPCASTRAVRSHRASRLVRQLVGLGLQHRAVLVERR